MGSSTTESAPDDQVSPVYDNTGSGDEGKVADLPEPGALATEKVACDRCRRRKIKCDRVHPCSQCIRAQSQCLYPIAQKRAKRQRVLISSMYESRIEHISQKIDDLARLMEGSNNPIEKGPSHSGRNRNETYPVENSRRSRPTAVEHQGIDNSLFSYAISATKFLEEAVKFNGGERASSTVLEMRSALDTLQAVVDSQKRRNVADEAAPPFPGTLPLGITTRDLPVPPIDKVMACLRMAQDHAPIPMSWLGELKSFSDFTLCLVKVCSPGPVTDSELIIAYMGLYWLFGECATMTSNEARQDLNRQAEICQSSLEVVLSSLGFHIPTTIDYVLAMYLATLYCFQKNKIFACWTFISKASLHAQALGLHSSASMTGDTIEERHRKTRLFWSIYSLERGVSLRLARPSTIRDHDITIPEPKPETSTSTAIIQSLLESVNAARIYGLVYDDIYSPRALAQPAETRTARVHALAAEWEEILTSKAVHLTKLARCFEGLHESAVIEFTRHAKKASDYVMLTAIHRGTPGRTPASISAECTSAARIALQGHIECITLLLNNELHSVLLEMWVNGALLLLPFLSVNIVFCNVVETANLDDLNSLKALVQVMELLSEKPHYASCAKQLRIFRALYNVAARYVEVKGEAYFAARSGSADPDVGKGSNNIGGPGDGLELLPVPQVLESQTWAGLGGMELDPFGTQFSSWFEESNDLMDFLGGQ
ncbi:fungal-specific transcription factor domain-containing protein [Ilyonectria sp. MPI-CAGE-AT-0026]|nr:fungal-specific transcription factor domain-containing protein [Ilyonectria sp. MPI-CAGE-AT-0026]